MVDDLLGLGKAAEKLIDVVQRGIGGALGPWHLKRMERARTEAEIDRKKLLKAADKQMAEEERKALPPVPELATRPDDEIVIDVELLPPVDERASDRLSYQEQKRQLNVENVIFEAAEELKGVPDAKVADEPVDDDWTARFFTNIQDVSSEDLQKLWAKILAGEIKRPGTFSLRTLETLRNLSRREAEVFTEAAALATSVGMIPETEYRNKVLPFSNAALLQDAGLLTSDFGLQTQYASRVEGKYEAWCAFRTLALRFSHAQHGKSFSIPVYRLTAVGAELARALVSETNVEMVRSMAEAVSKSGYRVTMHKLLAETASEFLPAAAVLESWGSDPEPKPEPKPDSNTEASPE